MFGSGQGLTVFRIAGIPVELRLGFLVIVFLVAWPFLGSFDPQAWITAGIVLATLVISVFLHELGHVGARHALGIKTHRIAFDWFGGVPMMDRFPPSVVGRVFVLLAGPAVTVVLMGLGYGAEHWIGSMEDPSPDALSFIDYAYLVAALCSQINLVLLIFNLMPAFPLDGGQTLAALLEGPLGRRIAFMVVSAIGSALALVAIYLVFQGYTGLAMGALMLALSNVSILRQTWIAGRQQQPDNTH
jgi:Zn-dependent protease